MSGTGKTTLVSVNFLFINLRKSINNHH